MIFLLWLILCVLLLMVMYDMPLAWLATCAITGLITLAI